jgi:hypothetical protein
MKKSLIVLLLLFALVELTRHFLGGIPFRHGMQAAFVHGANFLMLVVSCVALWLLKQSLAIKNPHAFVRAVMGSMIIKMLVLLGGLVLFLSLTEEKLNKQAVIASLCIYFVYLITEVTLAMKMNRESNA